MPIREITNPNSFLTLVNGDGTVKQIGNSVDGGSSDNLESVGDHDFTIGVGGAWDTDDLVGDVTFLNETARLSAYDIKASIMQRAGPMGLVPGKNYMIMVEAYREAGTGGFSIAFGGKGVTTYNMIDGVQYFPFTKVDTHTYGLQLSVHNSQNCVWVIHNTSVKEILPTSTTYDLTNQTVLEATPTTVPFTVGDLALIEADTSLMTRLSKGATDTGLSLVTADVFGHYAFMEKEGAYCVDDKAGYDVDILQDSTTISYGTTTMVLTGNGYDATGDLSGTTSSPRLKLNGIVGKIYVIDIDTTINSGSCHDMRLIDGINTLFINQPMIAGKQAFTFRLLSNDGNGAYLSYNGLANVFDISVIGSMREATAAEISNYLATVRTNIDFNPKGNQGIEFERDGVGVPIAFNNTQMNMHSDTSADILWNPSIYSEFIIEESVGLTFYSHIFKGGNLRTWTDGIEGVGAGHTPENANYLLGKGVYPKVTADPYTAYVQDHFVVILDATEIANYDALQAYNDYIA